MSANIVIFPRGQLSPRDKERLTKAGITAIEADDPSKVVCLAPGVPLASADDLLMSALIGMSGDGSGNERSSFARELTRRLKQREQEGNQS